ncbi:MAG: hypothetical protein OEV66_08370, partial [Spirochaetia bacterium]|nr:hypothetical protein [Spirochaetia bacterium]
LYYLSGQTEKADRICDDLINQDSEHIFTYMEWKYKIYRRGKNRYQMEALKNMVRNITGNFSEDKISRKNNLLQKIQEDLSANPQYNEIFNREKARQENITYPE